MIRLDQMISWLLVEIDYRGTEIDRPPRSLRRAVPAVTSFFSILNLSINDSKEPSLLVCIMNNSIILCIFFFILDALPNYTRRNGSGPYSDLAGYRMSAYKEHEETLLGHVGFRF